MPRYPAARAAAKQAAQPADGHPYNDAGQKGSQVLISRPRHCIRCAQVTSLLYVASFARNAPSDDADRLLSTQQCMQACRNALDATCARQQSSYISNRGDEACDTYLQKGKVSNSLSCSNDLRVGPRVSHAGQGRMTRWQRRKLSTCV
eukprot:310496-Chlamydomonas_euryale.AAC.2